MRNQWLPKPVEIVRRVQETPGVFSLRLRFVNPRDASNFAFQPGQFNMIGLPGSGEIPISIVSDPEDELGLDHTIRAVGRITEALSKLDVGAQISLRGPLGRGWPLTQAQGQDVLILTGGLGCAPSISAIHYILRRRELFGRLTIIQGVRHGDDLIWHSRYEQWRKEPNTQVLLAADEESQSWNNYVGHATDLIARADLDSQHTLAMMCGPEIMMHNGVIRLNEIGIPDDAIYLSMERNMHCGIGHCGHCQIGPHFVCKNGPVFNYTEIRDWFALEGF